MKEQKQFIDEMSGEIPYEKRNIKGILSREEYVQIYFYRATFAMSPEDTEGECSSRW